MDKRRRSWYAINAYVQHKQSDDVGQGIPSSPLYSTHNQITSSVECHHLLWTTHTNKVHWTWHAIIALGEISRSNAVGHRMLVWSLDSTHDQMMSSVACHNHPSTTHTIRLRRPWHTIFTLRHHAWSYNIMCGIISSHLESIHGRTTSM